ncbi:MAG: hypothetical protein VX988_11875 [Planctomycetota bacterium]|nr:hypothetical protein [Planctomycetota bacterium]
MQTRPGELFIMRNAGNIAPKLLVGKRRVRASVPRFGNHCRGTSLKGTLFVTILSFANSLSR